MDTNRREFERAGCGLPGVVIRAGVARTDGIVRDISESGVFIYGAHGLTVGKWCDVAVLFGGVTIDAEAVVVRVSSAGCALDFQRIGASSLTTIRDWVEQHGRAEGEMAAELARWRAQRGVGAAG